MRAVVNTRAGGPEVLEEHLRPIPEPGLGQLRVRVRASALNRADMIQRMGNYPAPPGASPDIPGLEYAGEVDAVGDGATLWPVGSRVMGIVGGGAHAEYVCVHEREAMPMPRGMSFEDAAAIPEAFLTGYDALFRQLDVRLGERVVVHAIGSGVGTATLQLALLAGASVLGTSRSASKLERARALGLVHAVDTSTSDWGAQVEALLGANAVHAIVDLLGGDYLRDNLRVLAPRGRLVSVGLTAGSRTDIDLGVVMRKRLTIIGTALRSRAMEEKISLAREFSQRVVPLFESGKLQPVIERVLPFSEVRTAHEQMAANTTFGKLVLRW
ncbi:MAG: putative quinone oxidoreductase, family [Gemmatimonadetes bacterium]|nr:putative quinone oxidoreductase, family [Gemmatimonadota bacterium]